MSGKLDGIEIPDLTSIQTVKFDMNSNSNLVLPTEILDKLKSSDVTTITQNTKTMADYMFSQMSPVIISKITQGVDSGINGIQGSITQMDQAIAGMVATVKAMNGMGGSSAIQATIDNMTLAKTGMTSTISKMEALEAAVPGSFDTAKVNYLKEIDNRSGVIENEFQTTLNHGFMQVYSTVAIASILALLVLMFYKENQRNLNKVEKSDIEKVTEEY